MNLPETTPNQSAALQLQKIRRQAFLGLVIGLFSLVIFLLWAAFMPLASAIVAQGRLIVESGAQQIQHLEGGIVREILVTRGQHVDAGQVLLRLDQLQAGASLSAIQSQLAASLAEQTRLEAERRAQNELAEPKNTEELPQEIWQQAWAGQKALWQSRRDVREGRLAVMQQRRAQLAQEAEGLNMQLQALQQQRQLIGDEIVDAKQLYEKGYERLPRVRALERAAADLDGRIGQLVAEQAKNQHALTELELQQQGLENEWQNAIATEMRTTEQKLAELRQRRKSASDIVARAELVAPVAGVISDIIPYGAGAVIAAGSPLMTLVPEQEIMLIEVMVRPDDIESVSPQMPARIRLSAFNQKRVPEIDGTVMFVASDLSTDPMTGQKYFKARVAPDSKALTALQLRLVPGMPAEALIITGSRTLLNYLLSPLSDGLRHALREG